MQQHVLSGWLLKAFATLDSRHALAVYDKAAGSFGQTTAEEFMTELDAHPTTIEAAFGAIEAQAAAAAQRLRKRVKYIPAGMYAFVNEPSSSMLPESIEYGGMKLMYTGLEIQAPSPQDQLALAEYVALMYQRAPRLEAAILAFGHAYDRGAQLALDFLAPGIRSGLSTEITKGRERMIQRAKDIGATLAQAHWWVVRPRASERFVLGDSPVAATISLGHPDGFRAILADTSYVVAMPLGPTLAIIIAPQSIMPMNVDVADAASAINQLVWRSAGRYVLARNRSYLDSVWPSASEEAVRRDTIPADAGALRSEWRGRGDVSRIVVQYVWRQWLASGQVFGHVPFAAQDRDLIMPVSCASAM